jgi:DNA modification methylase
MLKFHMKTIYEALGRESVHPFPARMAPGIALKLMCDAKKSIRVLDPMMGSGTVLALARSKQHKAIGIDIDPLAVLIARVWTKAVNKRRVRHAATNVLLRARQIFATLPTRDAYPVSADPETRRFIAYWFDDYARRQLASLASAISRIRDTPTRDALWCAFSRLIITKQSGASLAMDLSHSRPHKAFQRAPIKPFRKFMAAVERVTENCIDVNSSGRGPAPSVHLGDARNLPLTENSVDLVLTSPPYLNAIDYIRCSKFSLVWMGYGIPELRRLRSESIGTASGAATTPHLRHVSNIIATLKLRPALRPNEQIVLGRYIDDIHRSMGEAARVLSPNGKAIYVIGENTIKGTYIRNSVIVRAVARLAGLKLECQHFRTLPPSRRYLPPPVRKSRHAALNTRMRREVILAFTKTRVASAA